MRFGEDLFKFCDKKETETIIFNFRVEEDVSEEAALQTS